jgi:MFS family permease
MPTRPAICLWIIAPAGELFSYQSGALATHGRSRNWPLGVRRTGWGRKSGGVFFRATPGFDIDRQIYQSPNTVALATSLTTIGGIVAAFVIGPSMDRFGPYGSLATVYFAGVVFVGLLGQAVSASSWMLLIAAFCAGFCISGGQKSVIALAAIFYPAPIRSTGVG